MKLFISLAISMLMIAPLYGAYVYGGKITAPTCGTSGQFLQANGDCTYQFATQSGASTLLSSTNTWTANQTFTGTTMSSWTVTGQEAWLGAGQSGNVLMYVGDRTNFLFWAQGSQALEFYVNNANPMSLSNGNVLYPSTAITQWLSGGFGNPADLGLARQGAGVLEVNNGSSGQLRDLKARYVTVSSMTFTGATAPPDSQALCLLSGQMGHCTTVVGATGGCTCVVP